MDCKVCGVELTDENHEHNRLLCHDCRSNQRKKYYLNNRDRCLQLRRETYILKHDKIRATQKIYSQTENGKEANRRRNRKHKDKRNRGLGWVVLNEEFPNTEGHHINEMDVVYIPSEWNHIVPHNVHTGYNMDIINSYAYFFLMQQNIDKIIEVY